MWKPSYRPGEVGAEQPKDTDVITALLYQFFFLIACPESTVKVDKAAAASDP